MPIYEYECTECGKSHETVLPMARMTPTRRCPWCDTEGAAKKVINFQGSVLTDDAPWLRESAEILSEPVEGGQVPATRKGLRAHLDKNEIEHKETGGENLWMV